MKTKDLVKLLLPGVIVGALLGFGLGMLAGVNTDDAIPNYIGGALCCLIPTLLNCIIVMKSGAKILDREVSILEILKRILPYLFLALVIGVLSYVVILEQFAGIDSRDLTNVANAGYQAMLGVMVSTVMAYVAVTKYAADVKYTKRTTKKKSK